MERYGVTLITLQSLLFSGSLNCKVSVKHPIFVLI